MMITKTSVIIGTLSAVMVVSLPFLVPDQALVEESATKVYKQVDPNGHITFTDSPPIDNTQTVEQIEINVKSSGVTLDKTEFEDKSIMPTQIDTENPEAAEEKPAQTRSYQLSITTPKTGQVFSPDTLEILSGIELKPKLAEEDRIQVLVNETPVLPPQSETAFKLPFLPGGKHELKVQVVDKEGNVLGESAPIFFTQMRISSQ